MIKQNRPLIAIIAQYHLGIPQGKEIIEWAHDIFVNTTDFDADFIESIAFLDKSDEWEKAKAETIFFDHFKMNADEILNVVKRFFVELLERITDRKVKLYALADIVSRINTKYKQPEWINDLFGFCAYVMPDSELAAKSRLEIEINSTISELRKVYPIQSS